MYSIKNYVYDFGIFALVSNGFFFPKNINIYINLSNLIWI